MRPGWIWPGNTVVAGAEALAAISKPLSAEEAAQERLLQPPRCPAEAGFWLSDCGCRASAEDKCRSRIDVCLGFVREANSGGGNLRPAKVVDALEVLAEGGRHHLVTRPFADKAGKVVAICFCCDCHCAYFRDPGLAGSCAPGRLVAIPDDDSCDGCGECVSVCYFGARGEGGALAHPERCVGCGLCAEACPSGAIAMAGREAARR